MHKPTTTCGVDIEHRFQSSRHENNGLENEPAGHNVGITRHPAQYEHLIKTRQYYRDMVLGVNDGLVSTFLLVAGVVGGGMDVKAILLTAVSGAIAGAISMFAGEYVATKSQNEVMTGVRFKVFLNDTLFFIAYEIAFNFGRDDARFCSQYFFCVLYII